MRILLPTLLVLGACQMPATQSDPRPTGQEPDVSEDPTDPDATDPAVDAERAAIAAVIDDWHDAASQADEPRYLGHFTEDAVFMGTDASERWTLEEFSGYVRQYFPDRVVDGQSRKGGWTYLPHDRHIALSGDATLAWFDEQLTNEGYGDLRGTGVMRKEDGSWRLAHYSMTFTVPNDIAREVVGTIREFQEQR